MMKLNVAAAIILAFFCQTTSAFSPPRFGGAPPLRTTSPSLARLAAGKGFGTGGSDSDSTNSNSNNAKSYGDKVGAPIRDMIDSEAAMQNFFSSREEWIPLFRSIAVDTSCQAMSFLGNEIDIDVEIDFHETSEPWKRLQAIPELEEDKQVLGGFLDSMQQALVDIPVNEAVDDDENDMQFLEEGRRMLAVSRFQVLRENQGGSVESNDALFATCWNELMELSSSGEKHTGSLIVLPEYELTDLRRFTDMNLLRPLEWLGVHADFEISSMQRGSPAIRLLYKLKDMPSTPYTAEKGFAAADDEEGEEEELE
jgi:hypothetical protein